MRLATVRGRAHLVLDNDSMVDVAIASGGALPSEPSEIFEAWDAVREWAASASFEGKGRKVSESDLGAPSADPRQVFAVGLNYGAHAAESGIVGKPSPQIFTKFRSSLSAPYEDLVLPSNCVDWEVELVAVVGRTAQDVAEGDAWSYIAGLTLGQDYSERELQMTGDYPQFSLAKSFPGFSPTGPFLVTPDEFVDPDDLRIECLINGEVMQSAQTSSMILAIPELVARLSGVCTLYPGDLIFTGTPSGVGFARTPQRYLAPGDVVVSRAESIGEIRQQCLPAPA